MGENRGRYFGNGQLLGRALFKDKLGRLLQSSLEIRLSTNELSKLDRSFPRL